MRDLFTYIGVAASIGAVSFLLAMSPVIDAIQWPFKKIQGKIRGIKLACRKHGLKKGLRYYLGVKLLLPYMTARYNNSKALYESIETPSRAWQPELVDVYRKERVMGMQLELVAWARFDGGGEKD